MEYGTTYKVNFLHGSIKDLSYIDLDIGDSSLNEYFITIKDDPRPVISSISPDYDATAVPINSSISITFNMDVYPGTSGLININEVDPASGEAFLYTFQQFNFADQDDISAISGWGTPTISFITPTPDVIENFNYETIYTVSIENTVIRNSEDGTEYFTGLEATTYQFRTVLKLLDFNNVLIHAFDFTNYQIFFFVKYIILENGKVPQKLQKNIRLSCRGIPRNRSQNNWWSY